MNKHSLGHLNSIQSKVSSRQIMWTVILATIPALITIVSEHGSRILAMMLTGVITAIVVEGLFLLLRKQAIADIFRQLSDGSAILTAILLVYSLPLLAPSWLIIFGICFAIIFAKQLYGGMGMNIFNPAMVGYCFLLISFPTQMSQQSALSLPFSSFWDSGSFINQIGNIDGITSATILDSARQHRIMQTMIDNHAWQNYQPYLLCAIWFISGIFLLIKGYVSWRIIVSSFAGLIITATIFWWINPQLYLNPLTQLLAGASIFGIFFIATDPVTAASSNKGRWIFGLLIGSITICIRNLGNFPDGFAFAVLLANALVPLIDTYTKPQYK